MKPLKCIFLVIGLLSYGLVNGQESKPSLGEIQIQWKSKVAGDFSFKDTWEYPEGVFKNEFGQLSCDGICPPEVDRMIDENGKIFTDSLAAFYKLVDTTHQFHSIRSDAWCYEWAGTDFITIKKVGEYTFDCSTQTNMATHCSLQLKIIRDKCYPSIKLNSIAGTGLTTYACNGGQIQIDQALWAKGIMKATFSFTFNHTENPHQPMYWKGKIYANL